MDAEHRHELKQNDFVVYAKKAPDYIKTHWWEAICVVVILVAVVMMFSNKTAKVRPNIEKEAKVTAIYQDISTAKVDALSDEAAIDEMDTLVADLLEKGAKLSGAPKAMVKIKAADAVRAQLHYGDGMPQQEVIDAKIAKAIGLYEEAMQDGKGNVDIEAMAQYGIALAKQDGGNFDEAATIYGQIVANTAFDKTGFVELAKDKLAVIAMSSEKFTFAEPVAAPVVEEVEVKEENTVN